jgi:hypothetical protein
MSFTMNLGDAKPVSSSAWELDAVVQLIDLFHDALGHEFVMRVAAALVSDVDNQDDTCANRDCRR